MKDIKERNLIFKVRFFFEIDILMKMSSVDFRKKCTLFSLFEDEAFMQARYVTGELRLAALDLCIKKFDEMQSK